MSDIGKDRTYHLAFGGHITVIVENVRSVVELDEELWRLIDFRLSAICYIVWCDGSLIADEDCITCTAAQTVIVFAILVAAFGWAVIRFVELISRLINVGI